MGATASVKVGPVLSFRGIGTANGVTTWKVTALVGVAAGAADPVMQVNGTPRPPPVVLAERAGVRFLRYDLSVDLEAHERRVTYGFADEPQAWEFTKPAREGAPRMAYVSCNGFSDPKALRKLSRPANSVWVDLLCNHDKKFRQTGYVFDKEQLWHLDLSRGDAMQRFHVLLMGGDQIYFDSIWEDIPELERWARSSRSQQLAFKVSAALRRDIETYYFKLYCERWLAPKYGHWTIGKREFGSADAMASIPTVMMWDDHDIFDGWGSYTPEMQSCEVVQTLFHFARQAFWVFQMQHSLDKLPRLENRLAELMSPEAPQFSPIVWSQVLAGDSLALPLLDNQPGFSQGYVIGPVALFSADLRTERSRTQILGEPTWKALQTWTNALPKCTSAKGSAAQSHLLFMSSVPVAHPKLSLIESALDLLGQEHVTDSNADDLKDHWAHDDHEAERKRLIRLLIATAEEKRMRAEILSGDVHVAAWGSVFRNDATPDKNYYRIQQFTSSGVVHPSLTGPIEGIFLGLLNSTAASAQPIDSEHDVEMMQFPAHNRHVMAARNWLALEPDHEFDATKGPRLWATWRCESPDGFSNHLLAVHPAPRGE